MKNRTAFMLLGFLSAAWAAPSDRNGLLLVSIDGLNPEYVTHADRYGLKIPNLRRILRDGSHATSVQGVLPTVTYPTHTTMLTGVWPAKHGIYNNVTFDPLQTNLGGWYWYAEDIRVPTLWESASKAGYIVGSVAWPVSVGAKGVHHLIPEYWRAMTTADDLKLLRALSSPGLISSLQSVHGNYIIDLDDATPGDWMRTRYAASIIKSRNARVLTLHLASLDHIEHHTGPVNEKAFAALEEIDKMVGVLEDAIRSVAPDAAVCIVSDHGMARVEHELNLRVAFVKAGLITPAPDPPRSRTPGIATWKAQPWTAGGSAAIVVKDPADKETLAQVERLLQELAADAANGIASILDRKSITKLGGDPTTTLWVDLRPGFAMGSAMAGPLIKDVPIRGTHGYAPTHPEMRASFFIAGPRIRKGKALGAIDIRSIGPTLAQYLGVSLPAADLKPLPVF